jgi:hypothetical protein
MILAQYKPVNREAIFAGLFAWLQSQLAADAPALTATCEALGITAYGFASMGRKHVAPPDLSVADQPALFQVAAKEVHIPQKVPGAGSKLVLRGFLIGYVFDDSPDEDIGQESVLAESTVNNLLTLIDAAFSPDNMTTGKFTIGGLVTHCWIEGDTDLDPGIFGPQCAFILPLNILV